MTILLLCVLKHMYPFFAFLVCKVYVCFIVLDSRKSLFKVTPNYHYNDGSVHDVYSIVFTSVKLMLSWEPGKLIGHSLRNVLSRHGQGDKAFDL